MFFTKKAPLTKPQLTDEEIKRRAAAKRQEMGLRCATAVGSVFKYSKDTPTVLGQRMI